MSSLLDWLVRVKTDVLPASVISLVISAAVTWVSKRWEARDTAETAYRYEQRKKQHEVIGRHYGRLVAAANTLGYRMWNIYVNRDMKWLDKARDDDGGGYYFKSTVFRFMGFFAVVRCAEKEAILLDGRVASKKDYLFLNYIEAFHWVMTDTALFDGLRYDHEMQRDHFFADEFRRYCELCSQEAGQLTFEWFCDGPLRSSRLTPVLNFFDGMSPVEERLRWDRLVSLHLLIQAFLNDFGYVRQHATMEKFVRIAKEARNKRVLTNLLQWLPRHELGRDGGTKRVAAAIRQATK